MKAPDKETMVKAFANMETRTLIELFCLTTYNVDKYIPTVRGWLMDEIERRNPEGFKRWLEGEAIDEAIGEYILV